MTKFTFDNLPKPAPSKTAVPAKNNGFLQKMPPEKRNGAKTDPKRTNNKPKGLAAQLMDSIENLEKSRCDTNDSCKLMITKITNHPHAVQFLSEKIVADKANDAAKYSIGLQSVLDLFDEGQPFALVDACNTIAKNNAALGRDFLTKRVTPIITTLNLLKQNTDNTYRWATYNELAISCPGKHQVLRKLKHGAIAKVRAAKTNRVMRRNGGNPYLLVDASGNVERFRKVFEGDLTKEEAKLLRDLDAAKAKNKIIEETRKLNDKAAIRDQEKAGRELVAQQQQLWAEGELQRTELQIRQAIQSQKLSTFQKPAIALGVIAIIAMVMMNIDKLPPMPEQSVMQAKVPAFNYKAPNWSAE